MPITATCTGGSEVTIRPLPSFVTITTDPVSAMPKLTPEMPISASRNRSRSLSWAKWQSSAGTSDRSPPSSREKSSATSPLVLWIAGAMMCDGVSRASWMIHSPRSVSTTWMPAPSSTAFSSISSDAIDFDLTTRRTPRRLATPRT